MKAGKEEQEKKDWGKEGRKIHLEVDYRTAHPDCFGTDLLGRERVTDTGTTVFHKPYIYFACVCV